MERCDGKWIYYFSNRGKQAQIWKMQVTGGPETQVTNNGGLWSNESANGKDLYHVNENGLWKIPVSGGDEVKVEESYSFTSARNGIYYAPGSQEGRSTFQVNFLDFKTHRTRTLGILPGPLGWNFDVSPDERWIIYGKYDRQGSELMLVDNFR